MSADTRRGCELHMHGAYNGWAKNLEAGRHYRLLRSEFAFRAVLKEMHWATLQRLCFSKSVLLQRGPLSDCELH